MSTLTIKIVDRKYLERYYNSSFLMFEDCCSECWFCKRRKTIQDEFKKKKDFILLIPEYLLGK